MAAALIHLPAVVRGAHDVSMEETVAAFQALNYFRDEDHHLLSRFEGLAVNTHIKSRQWARSLSDVARAKTFEERNGPAVEAMKEMGEQAAREAIKNAGCTPGEITGIITSHSTTPTCPGPAQEWIEHLGIPSDVLYLPMTELGCVGGAHSIALAARLVTGRPGEKVVVDVSEILHTVYRGEVADVSEAVHDLLYSDLAAACVVSDLTDDHDADGLGIIIEDTWFYSVPGTAKEYRLTTGSEGQRFSSERSAPKTVRKVIDPLWEWLRARDPQWAPDVVLAHPGSSKILEEIEDGLGCTREQISESWKSYEEGGNQGGGTVIDIARRYLEDRPVHGARVLMFAVGPGFSGAAILGRVLNRVG